MTVLRSGAPCRGYRADSGIGSLPHDRFVHAIDSPLHATVPGGFQIAAKPVPLSEVEQAWPYDDGTRRTVLTVDLHKS